MSRQPISARLNAICFIEAIKPDNCYVSCGVFISPTHVLMAHHAFKGAKDLTFTTANGNAATVVHVGGIHALSEELDMAVVQVQSNDPIDFAHINFQGQANGSLLQHNKGFLGTRYQEALELHKVTLPVAPQREDIATYKANVQTKVGFSGSPVYGSDGETVISLVTHVDLNKQERDLEASQSRPNVRIRFNGPSINAFSDFMKRANGLTNFSPSGPKIAW